MLTTSATLQEHIWILQRLYRICAALRSGSRSEPCLEQYEQQVRLMLDEDVPPAASAWLSIIAQCLRTDTAFHPERYIPRE